MLLVGSCGGDEYRRADWREQAALAMPPQEMWSPATPNMAAEIDYETLIGPGATDPSLVADSVESDYSAEPVESDPAATDVMIDDPDAASQEPQQVASNEETLPEEAPPAKPGAMVINAIAVPKVKGSPGDGNAELTDAMRRTLREAGVPVVDTPRKDAITITGAVKLSPSEGSTQKVGVNWTVLSPDGAILGAIKQSNDIPTGSLDHGWGDTASFAAQAAATGIFDLIKKFR